MSRRQKKLARLDEELSTMALFDRVHHYATCSDPADEQAYASREARRLEIMTEIRRLSANLKSGNHALRRSTALFLCAMFFYLLK